MYPETSSSGIVPTVNRIGTATPANDVHEAFVSFAREMLPDRRNRALFERMVSRSGIAHRWSVVKPAAETGGQAIDDQGWYSRGHFPSTGQRMRAYEQHALPLALEAVAQLGPLEGITHLIVASCTGLVAPGLDQRLVAALGLSHTVERTSIGFMGCSAAVPSLRTAYHTVRSDPSARVLVVALELCTLHLQESDSLETMLSFLLFGDGCAAALVTADPGGLALRGFRAHAIADTQDMITWRIGDQGFDMILSGQVPVQIGGALRSDLARNDDLGILCGRRPEDYDLWAVHAGGRTVLDAVEQGYGLHDAALKHSRAVLHDCGNVSSATILFVLRRMLEQEKAGQQGIAMAFGPGMSAETFRFTLQ